MPDDCMVILAKPDMVKKIERLDLDSSLGIVAGPKIFFEATVDEIRHSSMKSLAKSADLVRFFKAARVKSKWEKNTKISMSS